MENNTFNIKVTQDHIDHGTPSTCPIARAIALAVKTAIPYSVVTIQVGNSTVILRKDGVLYRAPLPPIAASFIWDFDWGTAPTPIEFPLSFTIVP